MFASIHGEKRVKSNCANSPAAIYTTATSAMCNSSMTRLKRNERPLSLGTELCRKRSVQLA